LVKYGAFPIIRPVLWGPISLWTYIRPIFYFLIFIGLELWETLGCLGGINYLITALLNLRNWRMTLDSCGWSCSWNRKCQKHSY